MPPAVTVELPCAMTGPACGPSPCGATAAPITAIGCPFTSTVGTSAPMIAPPAVSAVIRDTPGMAQPFRWIAAPFSVMPDASRTSVEPFDEMTIESFVMVTLDAPTV